MIAEHSRWVTSLVITLCAIFSPAEAPLAAPRTDQTWTSQSLAMTSRLLEQEQQRSLAFSPESLRRVLELLREGAAGEARRELSGLLGPGSQPVPAASSHDPAIYATAVFVREPLQIDRTFAKRIASLYGASAQSARQADGGKMIDDWVARATQSKIRGLLGTRELPTELVAVNALYFEGKWQHPFDPKRTSPKSFVGQGGETLIPFMAVEGSFAYLANEQIEAVSLPYAGGGYVLDLIMPRRASSTALTRLLEKPGSWIGLRQTSHRYGHVEIPRIDIESRFELKDTLSSAGMVAAFDPGRADFTAMTSDRARLFVGRVIQKVKLTLDEKGTIAAAATAAEMIGGLDPRPEFSFMANRPFLLMLRRISDNRLLIIGVFDATVH